MSDAAETSSYSKENGAETDPRRQISDSSLFYPISIMTTLSKEHSRVARKKFLTPFFQGDVRQLNLISASLPFQGAEYA